MNATSVKILMVEDNEGDVVLTREALKAAKIANCVHAVQDGVEALEFLHRQGRYALAPRPDLILLDLNLPRMDGREFLARIKAESKLRAIPVVVLTSSSAEEDVVRSYDLHANCYIIKPVDFNRLLEIVRSIEDFWLSVVRLPPNTK